MLVLSVAGYHICVDACCSEARNEAINRAVICLHTMGWVGDALPLIAVLKALSKHSLPHFRSRLYVDPSLFLALVTACIYLYDATLCTTAC